jgi:hypothetical protein
MKPLLFALGLDPNWGLYAPALLRLARREGVGIHVLETGAPLGTGTFTSSAVHNELDISANPNAALAQDLEAVPEGMKSFGDPYPTADQPSEKTPTTSGDVTLAWPDTVIANAKMNDFIEDLVRYFKEAGFTATGEWRPDFEMAELPQYARSIGAEIVALPKAGGLTGVIQAPVVANLEAAGLQVHLLEEISGAALNALEAANAAQGLTDTATVEQTVTDLNSAMQGQRPLEGLLGKVSRANVTGLGDTNLILEGETVTEATLQKARADNLTEALIAAVEVVVNPDNGSPQAKLQVPTRN